MLSTIERVLILKSVTLFPQVADEELAGVASQVAEVEFKAGEPIIRMGEEGTSMYVIVSGKVRAHIGDRELAILTDRAVFGELAALDPEPRSCSITAVEDTLLFRLDQTVLSELIEDHADVAHGIIRALVKLIRERDRQRYQASVGSSERSAPATAPR